VAGTVSLPAPHPRFGAIARATLLHYRFAWRTIVPLALLVFIPAGLLQEGARALFEAHVGNLLLRQVIVLLVAGGAGVVGYFFFSALLTHVVLAARRGHELRVGRLLRTVPYGRLVVDDSIVTAGTFVGLQLFVLPGVWVGTRFGLACPVLEIEDTSVRTSLRRSHELTRGAFWLTFAVILIPLIANEALHALGPDLIPGGHEGVSHLAGALAGALLIKPFGALALAELALALDRDRSSRALT
jgi:hypothetical protein